MTRSSEDCQRVVKVCQKAITHLSEGCQKPVGCPIVERIDIVEIDRNESWIYILEIYTNIRNIEEAV